MIVEKDVDLESIERSGIYTGKYFVLGGTVNLLDKEPDEKIRSREIYQTAEQEVASGTLREIVLALSATPDGEDTAAYMTRLLTPLIEAHGLTLSRFGRGLSTGSELEYADAETIKNAFQNRK
jgi:recombination protein RecR